MARKSCFRGSSLSEVATTTAKIPQQPKYPQQQPLFTLIELCDHQLAISSMSKVLLFCKRDAKMSFKNSNSSSIATFTETTVRRKKAVDDEDGSDGNSRCF